MLSGAQGYDRVRGPHGSASSPMPTSRGVCPAAALGLADCQSRADDSLVVSSWRVDIARVVAVARLLLSPTSPLASLDQAPRSDRGLVDADLAAEMATFP